MVRVDLPAHRMTDRVDPMDPADLMERAGHWARRMTGPRGGMGRADLPVRHMAALMDPMVRGGLSARRTMALVDPARRRISGDAEAAWNNA
jgi:hypothetical protein